MSCVAIIDVETTGLNPSRYHRVLEVAAVVMRPNGEILREFVSLVNPERDIGPTSIHGLTASDILQAPRFGEIAGLLCEQVQECGTLAGHNVRFDVMFLAYEFGRLGHILPPYPTICTLKLAGGGRLESCCQRYQIESHGDAHSALHDARATARLLARLVADSPEDFHQLASLPHIVWPSIQKTPMLPLTRSESRCRQSRPPTYLEKLLCRVESESPAYTTDETVLAYTALLDRVLEDRRVDQEEAQSLLELAEKWGLGGKRVEQIHQDYVHRLAMAALVDGIITESENRDLQIVAQLLGVCRDNLEEFLRPGACPTIGSTPAKASGMKPAVEELRGKRICFTGEFRCRLSGELISRGKATELVSQAGLIVVDSVTKELDLLVVSDPLTQSGKAKKARQYRIRIMEESVFWKAVGLAVE